MRKVSRNKLKALARSLLFFALSVGVLSLGSGAGALPHEDCDWICLDGNFDYVRLFCMASNLPTDCTDCWLFCPPCEE